MDHNSKLINKYSGLSGFFFKKNYNTFGEFLGYTTPKAKILAITYDYIQLKVGQDARIHKLEYNTMCSQSAK
jgi:hypothetical protein